MFKRFKTEIYVIVPIVALILATSPFFEKHYPAGHPPPMWMIACEGALVMAWGAFAMWKWSPYFQALFTKR